MEYCWNAAVRVTRNDVVGQPVRRREAIAHIRSHAVASRGVVRLRAYENTGQTCHILSFRNDQGRSYAVTERQIPNRLREGEATVLSYGRIALARTTRRKQFAYIGKGGSPAL